MKLGNHGNNGVLASTLFGVGKFFSIGFAVIAFISVFACMAMLLSTYIGDHFKTPKFEANSENSRLMRKLGDGDDEMKQQEEKVRLNQKYGSELLEIIKENNVPEIKAEVMINVMLNLPEEKHSKFVSGWDPYLKDGIAYVKSKNEKLENVGMVLTEAYVNEFEKAIANEKHGEQELLIQRGVIAATMVSSIFLLILSVMLPVLLKIERNTRGTVGFEVVPTPKTPVPPVKPATTAKAPIPPAQSSPVASLSCPKCKATVAENDVFCEGCGHRLK